VLSSSHDRTLKLWNLEKKQLIHSFDNHNNAVNHCAFSPDGKAALSASYDGTVAWHNLSSLKTTLKMGHLPGGYAVMDDHQLYDHSENAWRHLQWKLPNKDGSHTTVPFDMVG
jgi:WD40 repeat protein